VLGLAWFVAGVRASQRRLLVEWTSDLHLLNAEEFEWFVGEVFRRDGWQVKETGCQDAADGNIDLELTRDGKRMVAQCKRWTARPVGVGVVREFAGTLLREGLVGSDGLFVTLSDFTSQARSEAAKMGMVLVDKRDLYARAEKVRHSEDCPDCSTPMVLARSHRGWWMRCVASGCAGKRDLGNDPARAVDLLLQQA
jgi:HJR/Mrr/RecB family endonuclease